MRAQRATAGVVALGLIQGLTEFLPVSSSGHLVVGQRILGLARPSLLLDVVLHVGTLMPVLWLYRADLWAMTRALPRLPRARQLWDDDAALRLLAGVVVGSVPTAAIGLLGHDAFEALFSNTVAVGVAFLLTGFILMLARPRQGAEQARPPRSGEVTIFRALLVGTAQGAAITPGISRSGTTIAVGLLLGLERELAAKLSFVMSIPAIVGATALELRKAGWAGHSPVVLLLGAAAAAASGYVALRWVVRAVRRGALHRFAWYVWPLGLAVLAYSLLPS